MTLETVLRASYMLTSILSMSYITGPLLMMLILDPIYRTTGNGGSVIQGKGKGQYLTRGTRPFSHGVHTLIANMADKHVTKAA